MLKYVKRNPERILTWFVLVWTIGMSVIAIIQYRLFLYDGLDLGIYTQVLWNIVHGHGFAYTFNNYSYLADHREWILVALAPFFALVQHPSTLTTLQICIVASTAYPLCAIILDLYGDSYRARWIAVLSVVLFLFHPSVQSMVLYEFHALVFVIPGFAYMWLAFLRKRFDLVAFFSVLLLAIREDVGFTLAAAAIVMFFRSKNTRHRFYAIILTCFSIVYAVIMIAFGSIWFPGGSAKFLIFYPQLGSHIGDVLLTMVQHPLTAFEPLWQFDHPLIFILFISSVAFLSLGSPLYLLPIVPQLLLVSLIPKEMLTNAFLSHYAAPILIWVVISAIYGGKKIYDIHSSRLRLWIGVCVVMLIGMHAVVMSGVLFTFSRIMAAPSVVDVESAWRVVDSIDADDRVLVSHTFMTPLSTRSELYPMLQVFTGKDHYAHTTYKLPDQLDWIIWHPRDMVEMTMNFAFDDISSGWGRISSLIEKNQLRLVESTPDMVVYGRGTQISLVSQTVNEDRYLVPIENVVLNDCQLMSEGSQVLTCLFQTNELPASGDVHALIQWFDNTNKVISYQWVALVDDNLRPSHEWTIDASVPIVIPLRTVNAAVEVDMTLMLIRQQEKKIFLSRTIADIALFPNVIIDLTPIIYAGSEK